MTTDDGAWPSTLDERFAVPGPHRPTLVHRCATELVAAHTGDCPFDTPSWRAIADLDAADGFATRWAGRAVLQRSDGRFLIFRYPFRDGSLRFVIPGGGAEPGECALEAVEREVLEETGARPSELRPSGLVLYHLLASTIHDGDRTPTIQYSPIYLGTIDDELPDTGGRDAHWFDLDEFSRQPRRPISEPILHILAAARAGTDPEPYAVWLPA